MLDLEKNIGNILKCTKINFLFGAGCSYNWKDKQISYPLMSDLVKCVSYNEEIERFYDELWENSKGHDQYDIVKNIFEKYLGGKSPNIEIFLSILDGVDLYIVDQQLKNKVKEIQNKVRNIILDRIKQSDDSTVLDIYKEFYAELMWLNENRPTGKQNFNIFTTNYDLLNEKAMEDLNIHYFSGFYGIAKRKFNLSYYNYKYVDDFNIKGSSYSQNIDHINLFKLHGSISWYRDPKSNELYEKNPYEQEFLPEIIYPSVSKFENTNLIIHYSALMREFSNKICREDTTLIVCGTSMGDEHINKIIDNALTINSFTLVLCMFGRENIVNMKERYGKQKNVIILDREVTFKELCRILSKVNGEHHEK